jgi:DDE superfamily endonuclease
VLKLLVDVTEQPIRRPKQAKRRKKTYSGKKKRHTSKVEVVMTAAGKILLLSHTPHPGRKHDFRIRKEENPLHRDAEKYVDLGYQGLQKRTSFVILPFRRKKNQPLTVEQKNHNRQQASFRMKVEHKVRELKVFKILSGTYRNFGKKQPLRFNIMAGIINLRHGF